MANYVFVHGGSVSGQTWNKMVGEDVYPEDFKLGGQIWDVVSVYLKSKGHAVYAPTLFDEYQNNLSDHIEQIGELISSHQLNKVILVGHSYGGMVITGVADALPDSLEQLVYLDAALPEDGQSLFDLLILGGIDPTSIMEGEPKAYTEKIKIKIKANLSSSLPKQYIRSIESEFSSVTALAKQQILENPDGWDFQEIETGHLPMATEPDWLAHYMLGNASN